MKTTSLLLLLSLTVFAKAPEPVLTFWTHDDGDDYGVLSGKLKERPSLPVGVQVESRGLKFSTLTDPEGNWSLVFWPWRPNFKLSSFEISASKKP